MTFTSEMFTTDFIIYDTARNLLICKSCRCDISSANRALYRHLNELHSNLTTVKRKKIEELFNDCVAIVSSNLKEIRAAESHDYSSHLEIFSSEYRCNASNCFFHCIKSSIIDKHIQNSHSATDFLNSERRTHSIFVSTIFKQLAHYFSIDVSSSLVANDFVSNADSYFHLKVKLLERQHKQFLLRSAITTDKNEMRNL